MTKDNFGLSPAIERDCPKCASKLQIWQRWVDGAPKTPETCPNCGEAFLKADTGEGTNSHTGQKYIRHKRVEYTMIKVLKRGKNPDAS